jgi:hypothetical protein
MLGQQQARTASRSVRYQKKNDTLESRTTTLRVSRLCCVALVGRGIAVREALPMQRVRILAVGWNRRIGEGRVQCQATEASNPHSEQLSSRTGNRANLNNITFKAVCKALQGV